MINLLFLLLSTQVVKPYGFIFIILPLLLAGCLVAVNLNITVWENKLKLEIFPVMSLVIKLDGLKRIEIISTDPYKDYGGWGYRKKNHQHAFLVMGGRAIKLQFVNSMVVVFSTAQPDKLKQAIVLAHKNQHRVS
ncbi:MAG: hypothetical protein ACOYK8_02440 [Alphaproteobacteria bacterium]